MASKILVLLGMNFIQHSNSRKFAKSRTAYFTCLSSFNSIINPENSIKAECDGQIAHSARISSGLGGEGSPQFEQYLPGYN